MKKTLRLFLISAITALGASALALLVFLSAPAGGSGNTVLAADIPARADDYLLPGVNNIISSGITEPSYAVTYRDGDNVNAYNKEDIVFADSTEVSFMVELKGVEEIRIVYASSGSGPTLGYPRLQAWVTVNGQESKYDRAVTLRDSDVMTVNVYLCKYYLKNNDLMRSYTPYSSFTVRVVCEAALTVTPSNPEAVSAAFPYGSATYTLNGISKGTYASGQRLTAEGKYEFTVTMPSGKSKAATTYLDRTPPALSQVSGASKSSVQTSWSMGPYESPVSATYALNGEYVGAYLSGTNLTQEGKYTVTATDAAGNVSVATLFVDRTAPLVTRSAEYAGDRVWASWSVGGHESAVTASYTLLTSSGNSGSRPYDSGQPLTVEGKYTVTATDAAGNSSSVTFTVDRTPPAVILTAQITRDSASASWTVSPYEAPVTVTYTRDGEILGAYPQKLVVTLEGRYVFTATDAAGNVSTAILMVDKTAPTLTFTAQGEVFSGFTRDPFIATGRDNLSGINTLEILDNGTWRSYDYLPRFGNGAYQFRICDFAGNVTSAAVIVYRTDTFGNLAAIRDGYKLTSWYLVTLPARIFTTPGKDIAGRYSFATYNEALSFAVAKEREFRVTAVQGGWMYVSVTNEAVSQKYTDEGTLTSAVSQYAAGYVSSRQIASESGNDKFYTELDSLTRNLPQLPDYLLDYRALPRYYIKPTVLFNLPKLPYLSAMPYSVTAQYLGDFDTAGGAEYSVPSGTAFKTALGTSYRQGWYLIAESDAAGNRESYLVYSDAELPAARVKAAYGDGEEAFTLNYAFIKNESLYFISLRFDALLDNADPYLTLKLMKGSSSWYFTQSDALPFLGGKDFGAGKYTVTIFDRSLNCLTFDVFIAGDAPSWSHSSLAADRADCSVTFVPGDRYNVFTEISIYKIEYDGRRTRLAVDGAGVTVSEATLSYKITTGGKYVAVIKDNYRRSIELSSIFFLKGLPSGKLAGVTDGGRTNKNVSFVFSPGDAAAIYTLAGGGVREPFTNYSVQTGASSTVYNITASDATSHEFLVFLYAASDMSLYVEYTFEIDTILPEFTITASDGERIERDGATNKSFSILWSETGVTVRYYTARGGSLNTQRYEMGAVLTAGTLYYFTMKDNVGNTLEFTVLLDNAVDYTLSGQFNVVNGVLYANSPLTFTVNEPAPVFKVANADGYTIVNGGQLIREGRYEITVTDNYRNTLKLTIVIDTTPPKMALSGVVAGGSCKDPVTVTASGCDTLWQVDAKGNVLKEISSGTVFTLGGKYFITAADYAGNTATVSFSIDLGVDFTLSVPKGAVTTGKVTLTPGEPLTITVTLNGTAVTGNSYTAPGAYVITLTDELGNTAIIEFVIVPSRNREIDIALPEGTLVTDISRNGEPFASSGDILSLTESGTYAISLNCAGTAFMLEIVIDNTPPVVELKKDGNTVKLAGVDKESYTLKLTRDGSAVDFRIGQTLKDPGKYVLTVTDDLGNVAVIEFVIRYRMNVWGIVAIAAGIMLAVAAVILIVRARRKPRVN